MTQELGSCCSVFVCSSVQFTTGFTEALLLLLLQSQVLFLNCLFSTDLENTEYICVLFWFQAAVSFEMHIQKSSNVNVGVGCEPRRSLLVFVVLFINSLTFYINSSRDKSISLLN